MSLPVASSSENLRALRSFVPQCAVCLESLRDVPIFSTPCGHVFHKECISQWLRKGPTCPECRRLLNPRQIHRIYINWIYDEAMEAEVTKMRNQIVTATREANINKLLIAHNKADLVSRQCEITELTHQLNVLKMKLKEASKKSKENPQAESQKSKKVESKSVSFTGLRVRNENVTKKDKKNGHDTKNKAKENADPAGRMTRTKNNGKVAAAGNKSETPIAHRTRSHLRH